MRKFVRLSASILAGVILAGGLGFGVSHASQVKQTLKVSSNQTVQDKSEYKQDSKDVDEITYIVKQYASVGGTLDYRTANETIKKLGEYSYHGKAPSNAILLAIFKKYKCVATVKSYKIGEITFGTSKQKGELCKTGSVNVEATYHLSVNKNGKECQLERTNSAKLNLIYDRDSRTWKVMGIDLIK